LLDSPNPRVRANALYLLRTLRRHQLPAEDRQRLDLAGIGMLKDKDVDVQEAALYLLMDSKEVDAPREVLLPLLCSPRIGDINMTLHALGLNLQRYGAPPGESAWPKREPLECWDPKAQDRLSSLEAAPLTTNLMAFARLMGLKFLQLNGDAAAVDLTIPLLKDRVSLVRRRACDVMRLLSGENVSEADSVKWEEWWERNQGNFDSRRKTGGTVKKVPNP